MLLEVNKPAGDVI